MFTEPGDAHEQVIGQLDPLAVYGVRIRAVLADGRFGNASKIVISKLNGKSAEEAQQQSWFQCSCRTFILQKIG